MRSRLYFILAVLLGACANPPEKNDRLDISPPYPDAEEQKKWEAMQSAEPFAIVELFSSEGCSDCPSAELVLNKLTREAMADKSYIYPLAFHVDYWNKLGWKDVFSDSSYSNRQRMYRRAFGNEVVYTPQMIVNGKREFVGSDEKKARQVIDSVLKVKPPCYFTIHPDDSLQPADSTGKELTNFVHYEVMKIPGQLRTRFYTICFAIVERGLTTKVGKGENGGKTLQHENVVRLFKRYDLKEMKGKVDMGAFRDEQGRPLGKNFSLIAFIQDKVTMEIVGANLWNF
jgi:hypothetical protein